MCNYRIIMEFKGEKGIRAMFMYESEMKAYYKQEQMDSAKQAKYTMQKLNRNTNNWNKIN